MFSTTGFAWAGHGHQIVALIAEERLTPQAQTAIRELLGEDVNISDAEIANWADQRRRQGRVRQHFSRAGRQSFRRGPQRSCSLSNIVAGSGLCIPLHHCQRFTH